ncbi:MAG: hypothetical protein EOP04_20615, partial [Proteobacteria bacterium]
MTGTSITFNDPNVLKRSGFKVHIRRVYHIVSAFGFNPLKFVSLVVSFPGFISAFMETKKHARNSKDFNRFLLMPCLSDRFAQSGDAKGHYFHQDLRVASRIFQNNPLVHADVGSRIDGFV